MVLSVILVYPRPHVHVDTSINVNVWTCFHINVTTCMNVYVFTRIQWYMSSERTFYNASPHTLQYSCLDKLRVLTFMSAEHDVRVKTLLPKGANWTNSQTSSQDRCQSHWCCRAVFKSVRLCLLWQKYCTHPFLAITRKRVYIYEISIFDE